MYNDEWNANNEENTAGADSNRDAEQNQPQNNYQNDGWKNEGRDRSTDNVAQNTNPAGTMASGQNTQNQTGSSDTQNAYQNNPYQNQNMYQNNQYYQGMNGQPGHPGGNNNNFKKVISGIALVASIAIVAGAGFTTVNSVAKNFKQSTQQSLTNNTENKGKNNSPAATTDTVDTTSTDDTATDESVSSVVTNVMPAIVSINTTATENVTDYFGRTYQQDVQSAGSGIIIGQNSKEVLIVTNNHVITGANSDGVQVSFCDDEAVKATVKGTDSSNDLAVVSVSFADIKDSTKKEIKVASLGDSDKTKVGETAIAIGNALGYGQSVTVGHVSALNRELAVEDSSMTLMQTDAAINPGNSGGALLNAKGEVIGINSAKTATTEVEGMGYAIPISDALPIIDDLMNGTNKSEGDGAYLGIIGENITSAYAQRFNMPQGVYITQVAEGSPADKSGLVAGMIIVEFDGQKIETKEDLTNVIGSAKAGDKVTAVVYVNQNGSYVKKEVSVALGKKSDYVDSSDSSSNGKGSSGNSGKNKDDSMNPFGYGNGSNDSGNDSGNGFSFNY